jgi:hypothetical protein
MLWELLVTDGHVRAARLRRLQPWIIALGIILLWLGFMIIRLGPDLTPGVPAAAKLQERLAKLQQHAQNTFQKIPPLSLPADAQKSLPPAKEVTELVAAVLKSLNESGDLPEDDIKFKELDDADVFWKGDWGTEQVNYWRDGDNVLVAGNVSTGAPSYPQPARWIGLFHRGENKQGKDVWVYASVVGGNQFAPRELLYVSPQQIPLSLAPFLPEMPEPKQPEQRQ